jgi:hypothetical protein
MYVKLFGSILDSSIWDEDHATVRVWVTLLAMADADGVVRASDSGIAHRARVSRTECTKALKIFEAPDVESKSQEYGGQRIERVDGGWLLLNYTKYREARSREQVMAADRQARKRKRDSGQRDLSRDSTVTAGDITPQVDADVDRDAGTEKQPLVGLKPNQAESPAAVSPQETVPASAVGTALTAPATPNGKQPRTYTEIQAHLAAVLGEVKAGRQERFRADEIRTMQAELVFAYWQAECGHERALLDDKRLNRLKRCLKENGGNVHELLYAVKGWARDPTFQRLAEQDGRKLDGIDNIFRDRERIERLAGQCKGYREGKPHAMAVKYVEALQ